MREQRCRGPLIAAPSNEAAHGRDDFRQTDVVGPPQRAAGVRWKTDAVDHRDIDLIRSRDDAFADQLRAFIDHGVQATLEDLLFGELAPRQAASARVRREQCIDRRVGQRLAVLVIAVPAGTGLLPVATQCVELVDEVRSALAFREGLKEAGPVLLEPIVEIEVRVPKDYVGAVTGDLSSKRGKILGMDSEARYDVIRAQVPQAELYKYSTHLRSLTQGRASFRTKFSHYEEVPRELAEKVIAQAKADKEAMASA